MTSQPLKCMIIPNLSADISSLYFAVCRHRCIHTCSLVTVVFKDTTLVVNPVFQLLNILRACGSC